MNEENVGEDAGEQSLALLFAQAAGTHHTSWKENSPSQTVWCTCGYAKCLQASATSADSDMTLFPEGTNKGAHVDHKAPLLYTRRAAPDTLSQKIVLYLMMYQETSQRSKVKYTVRLACHTAANLAVIAN